MAYSDPLDVTTMPVFSRNHRQHLDAAVARAGQVTTLRSQARWVSAAKAVAPQQPIRIYFGVIDGGPDVEFEADLVEVVVDPVAGSEDVERLLAAVPSTTAAEDGLWGGAVQTLYAIRNCTQVSKPFPFTELRLMSSGAPLHRNYSRGYALVWERDA